MATKLGMAQSYVNTVPDKRTVTDEILMIEPVKIKTFLRLGTDFDKFNIVNKDGKQYEWLNDTFVPEATTINGTSMSASTTNTTFTPASLTLFQPGDIVLIETEQLWISAVSSGVATVTRGWGSTTAATHANGVAVTIVQNARIDGDEADDSAFTEVASVTNYTTIMQKTIKVARTKAKQAEYGISDLMQRMIEKRTTELMMNVNRIPYYGKRNTGSATEARQAGGFRTFITDNLTDASSAALTRDMIDDTLQDIFTDGGEPDLIICGAFAQRKINDFYEGFVQTERREMIGGIKIQQLMNPISGDLMDILVDRACPTNELWILDSKHIAFYPFEPLFFEPLSKGGDYDRGEVVGEMGFVVRYDKAHGLVHTFATS